MSWNLIEKAHAQAVVIGGKAIDTNTLLQNILREIVNPIVTLMVAVAVVVFLWGVFEFVRNAESSEERKKGGLHMLWGAIGLFIMVTAYGIVHLILGTIKAV
jgi:hypothetical protein